MRGPQFKLKHFLPLFGFLIPTLGIGYGLVIPRSCIAGINEPSIGFGLALVGASFAYVQGVRIALRDSKQHKGDGHASS